METSAAIPSMIEHENKSSRRRLERLSRHAIFVTKVKFTMRGLKERLFPDRRHKGRFGKRRPPWWRWGDLQSTEL